MRSPIGHLTSSSPMAFPDFDEEFFLTTDSTDAAVVTMLS